VTSEGSPHARFKRALAVGNGSAAYAAATELANVELQDALSLTLLLLPQSDLFDRACVRWVGRFSLEVREVGLATAHLALASLGSLQTGGTAGARALAELFEELGRDDLVATVEAWLAREPA
jgi:hypothetical protein